MAAPSNRTGFRPDAPTTAQRPRFRDKQTGIRDRKRTSTIINVDEVETYDGVADQCFIVARLIHDDVLEPQDFGRTIFVNTGDSGGGWHDISPSKRQRSSSAGSQSGASVSGWLGGDGLGGCVFPKGGGPAAATSKA